ncbi:MAG: Dps family protein [Cyclobacteriaceae bacterium]
MQNNKLIINQLNQLLADFQVYYQNLRGFHWNIQGREFFELHAKFEELYTDAAIKIDALAERILTVGGVPLHGFSDYLDTASIKPVKNVHDGATSVETIVDNIGKLINLEREIKNLAADAEDSGTEDMISALIEEQEKSLWMYKAWLK